MSRFRLLIPFVISLPIVAAIVALLWVLGSASGGRDKFSTLEIVPQDTVFYMAINTEPASSQWIAFNDVLETLNAKDPLQEALDEALAEVDLEWERDILPLAGDEAYFALTDIDGLEEGRGWVMAFQLRDSNRAEEIFLDLAAREEEEEGEVLLEEEYEGEKIYYSESDIGTFDSGFETPSVGEGSVAFVDDVLVIGFSRDDAKQVIDVIHGNSPSAEHNERLQDLRGRQDGDFIFWGYVDMADVWDAFVDLAAETGTSDFDTEQVIEEARASLDRMSFSVSARRDGFILDAFTFQGPDFEPEETVPLATVFDSRFAEMVPADTMAFVSGYDPFHSIYEPFRDAIAETSVDPDGQTFEELLDELEREIGFDFEDDLISLMTGEIAFAFNAADFSADVPEFDILALFDVSDAQKIQETMNRLGDYFERQELLITEASETENVFRWAEYEGSEEAAAWTVTKESLAVGYPASSVEEFVSQVGESLAGSSDWKRTMDLLPGDKTSIAYFSLSRLLEEIREMEDVEDEFNESTEGKVTFDDLMRIRSVGATTTTVEDGSGFHMVVLVQD